MFDIEPIVLSPEHPMPSPTATQSPFLPLSSREQEVLKLIMEGATNTEIARRLYVSPNKPEFGIRERQEKAGIS
jgi:DNA-binding NarL/FixJ family response regulator